MNYTELLINLRELLKDKTDEQIREKPNDYMRKIIYAIEYHTNIDLYNQFKDLLGYDLT